MTNDTSRDTARLYSLISRLSAIISDYSGTELRELSELAASNGLPFSDVMKALRDYAYLKRRRNPEAITETISGTTSASIVLPSQDRPPDSDRSLSREISTANDLRFIRRVLISQRFFPSPKKLAEFAAHELDLAITYNRDSRERMVAKVMKELSTLPPSSIIRIRQKISQLFGLARA
jgi:hypothetical protein